MGDVVVGGDAVVVTETAAVLDDDDEDEDELVLPTTVVAGTGEVRLLVGEEQEDRTATTATRPVAASRAACRGAVRAMKGVLLLGLAEQFAQTTEHTPQEVTQRIRRGPGDPPIGGELRRVAVEDRIVDPT